MCRNRAFKPDGAFAIMGDFRRVVRERLRPALGPWGDYLAIRRDARNEAVFASFGYFTMKMTLRPAGYLFNPFSICASGANPRRSPLERESDPTVTHRPVVRLVTTRVGRGLGR